MSTALMANMRPRIIRNACVYIKRSISAGGILSVQKHTEVAPHDILGKSRVSPGYSSVNLARQLGVNSKEADKYLQRQIGSTIYKGELLAFKKTIFGKKYVISPTDGILEEYYPKSGELRLKFLPKAVALTAGVFGVVSKVLPDKGEVFIKTLVTEVYGVYGFGRERSGMLHIVNSQNALLQPADLTSHMTGHILVAGSLVYLDAIRKAASLGVKAIISGGINFQDFNSMAGHFNPSERTDSDVGITIFATEGFGPIPIGADIYSALQEYDGRFVFTDGNDRRLLLPSGNPDSILTIRKTALPENNLPDPFPVVQAREITIGSKVRIVWPPLMGSEGVVIGIDKTATVLESGISTYMLAIETTKQKIKVPYPNVELLGTV